MCLRTWCIPQQSINQELEFLVGIEEARQHMEELVADRKQLSSQVAQLKGGGCPSFVI